jgi:hypothetical protein
MLLLSDALSTAAFHPKQARRVGQHLATGLAARHRAGLAHGDVRTGTVVLGDDGRARLAVPEAPEDADPAEDVYDLARVLLACLTGSSFGDVPPGLPEPWPDLLARMLSEDPAARPTAEHVAWALTD